MAERKNTTGKFSQAVKKSPARSGKSRTLPLAAIFWLIFFTIVTGLFLANRETIGKNFDLLTRRLGIPIGKGRVTAAEDKPGPAPSTDNSVRETTAPKSGSKPTDTPPAAVQTNRPADRPQSSDSQTRSSGQSGDRAGAAQTVTAQPSTTQPATTRPSTTQPAAQSTTQPATTRPSTTQPGAAQPAASQPAAAQPAAKSAETRERNIYFTQVDKDGTIHHLKVIRHVALSDSPMQDSLNAVLAGPTAEEQRRGVLNLIPPNTRILSCTVRGNTAYISFSEEFQYNTYGVEGYAAQLRQIIWTATEFSTVKDVQILIEGRRVDYLGEGIWIGSPVNRESL